MKRLFYSNSFSHLEAVFELLADEIEGDRVNAGVQGGHVDADVIHH